MSIIIKKSIIFCMAIFFLIIFSLLSKFFYDNARDFGVKEAARRTVNITVHTIQRLKPVPTDEEMIEYFNENREGFQKIVDFNRQSCMYTFNRTRPIKKAELLKMEKEIDVNATSRFGWLPNPYSEESLTYLRKIYPKDLFSEDKELCSYGEIVFHLEKYSKYQFYFDSITVWFTKEYIYYPSVPPIKKNRVIMPFPNNKSGSDLKSKLLTSSLDEFFKSKNRTELCALRQIEPQWFLTICRV